ncbi:MAG: antibiotic biosynthesis monooxygenase [Chitinophagales bacterium]
MLAQTPPPPYYAVVFTSIKTDDHEGYENMAERMNLLAREQPGYLGMESAREELGITVSYWESLEAISNWKKNSEHVFAQLTGKQKWYAAYKTRICKVERDYGFEKEIL